MRTVVYRVMVELDCPTGNGYSVTFGHLGVYALGVMVKQQVIGPSAAHWAVVRSGNRGNTERTRMGVFIFMDGVCWSSRKYRYLYLKYRLKAFAF